MPEGGRDLEIRYVMNSQGGKRISNRRKERERRMQREENEIGIKKHKTEKGT